MARFALVHNRRITAGFGAGGAALQETVSKALTDAKRLPITCELPRRPFAGRFRLRCSLERQALGGVPEWLKGADCKSAGYAYVGSNPTPSTNSPPKPHT
jgi:hypothetical protein